MAGEFSRTPGGRYRAEGKFSGEEFREEFLLPRFEEAVSRESLLVVNLDKGYGYASSFLEEAFGGLARKKGKALVRQFLRFTSQEEPYLIDDITRYITEA